MPIAKCARCGGLFDKIREPVCTKCLPDEDSDREKVRNALDRQPDASARAIAEAAEVDVEVVLRMVDTGILANEATLGDVKCGRCGAPAISRKQKLCRTCLDQLNLNVRNANDAIRLSQKKSVRVGRTELDVRRTVDEKLRTP